MPTHYLDDDGNFHLVFAPDEVASRLRPIFRVSDTMSFRQWVQGQCRQAIWEFVSRDGREMVVESLRDILPKWLSSREGWVAKMVRKEQRRYIDECL